MSQEQAFYGAAGIGRMVARVVRALLLEASGPDAMDPIQRIRT